MNPFAFHRFCKDGNSEGFAFHVSDWTEDLAECKFNALVKHCGPTEQAEGIYSHTMLSPYAARQLSAPR